MILSTFYPHQRFYLSLKKCPSKWMGYTFLVVCSGSPFYKQSNTPTLYNSLQLVAKTISMIIWFTIICFIIQCEMEFILIKELLLCINDFKNYLQNFINPVFRQSDKWAIYKKIRRRVLWTWIFPSTRQGWVPFRLVLNTYSSFEAWKQKKRKFWKAI